MNPRHVIVVGAGIVGSATAFRLAQAGLRVTLVDRGAPGSQASGKNAGHLNPIHLTPPRLVPFALECYEAQARLADDLAAMGCPGYGREPVRRILVALNREEAEGFKALQERFRGRESFPTRLLDRDSLRSLEPRVTPEAVGGLLLEGTMSVDPLALTRVLAEAAVKRGARLVRARVECLETSGRHVRAVCTGDGPLPCDDLVLATGPWVAETEQWLGLQLPVRPLKGQLLRMRAPRGGLPYDLSLNCGASLYRRGHNEVWVGGTEEDAGLDDTPTPEAREHLLAGAVRLMPEMADARLLEHTAALRPVTPDRMPILERARGWDNVVLANGGGNKGVLLAAGMAVAVRELLLGERRETSTIVAPTG